MGFFMKEHDIYVGSMLDELNLRFAPTRKGFALWRHSRDGRAAEGVQDL